MDINKQSQTAGANSQQVIAQTVNNYFGVSEERVRQIFDEKIPIAIKAYSAEAKVTASSRIARLEEIVFSKFEAKKDNLNAFADPAFQLSLIDAQKSAAVTDQNEKYNLLSDLLLERAESNDPEGSKTLAIDKAIEIVGKIPLEALQGLVLVYTVTFIRPLTEDFETRIKVYEDIFKNIIASIGIPSNARWIEDLDLLQLIRTNASSDFKKMKDYLPSIFKHLVTGLPENDPQLEEIKSELIKNDIPLDLLKPHPLKPGYIIFDLPGKVEDLLIYPINNPDDSHHLSENQIKILNEKIGLVNVDASEDENLKDALIEKWKESPSLKSVAEWWDTLTYHFSLTPAGRAIGNAILHSIYPELPMDF